MHKLLAKLLPAMGEASGTPGFRINLPLETQKEAEEAQTLIRGLRDLAGWKYETNVIKNSLDIVATE